MKLGKSLMSLGLVGVLVGSSLSVGAASDENVGKTTLKSPDYKVTGTYLIKDPKGDLFGEKVRGGALITGKAFKADTLIGNIRVGDQKSYHFGKPVVFGKMVSFGGIGLKAGKTYLVKSGDVGNGNLAGKFGEVISTDPRLIGKKFSFKKSGTGYLVAIDGKNFVYSKDTDRRVLAGNQINVSTDVLKELKGDTPVKKAPTTKPVKQPIKKVIGIPKPAPITKQGVGVSRIDSDKGTKVTESIKLSGKETKKRIKPVKKPIKKVIGIPKPAPIEPIKQK